LRYLIFLSILSGIFFVIYRQSYKKSFRRWWLAFKIAAYIAAILAGLIPASIKAIETSGNNDQKVVLVGRDSSGTASNVPYNIGPQGQGPSNVSTPLLGYTYTFTKN
jgi:hypothetical protein